MSKPLYNFQPYDDTPILCETIPPGSTDPNIYGTSIIKRGNIVIRRSIGIRPLYSIWVGGRLEITSYNSDHAVSFAQALIKL